MSYFKSLLAELMPGWTFWRSSRRPTPPLAGSPLDETVSRRLDETNRATGSEAPREPDPDAAKDRDAPR